MLREVLFAAGAAIQAYGTLYNVARDKGAQAVVSLLVNAFVLFLLIWGACTGG